MAGGTSLLIGAGAEIAGADGGLSDGSAMPSRSLAAGDSRVVEGRPSPLAGLKRDSTTSAEGTAGASDADSFFSSAAGATLSGFGGGADAGLGASLLKAAAGTMGSSEVAVTRRSTGGAGEGGFNASAGIAGAGGTDCRSASRSLPLFTGAAGGGAEGGTASGLGGAGTDGGRAVTPSAGAEGAGRGTDEGAGTTMPGAGAEGARGGGA